MTQDSRPMTILVTGGLGFIGSNLVPELRRREHNVWTCDLGHSEGSDHIRCDVTKYRQLREYSNSTALIMSIIWQQNTGAGTVKTTTRIYGSPT